jgi:hypothetical protein
MIILEESIPPVEQLCLEAARFYQSAGPQEISYGALAAYVRHRYTDYDVVVQGIPPYHPRYQRLKTRYDRRVRSWLNQALARRQPRAEASSQSPV